LLYTGNEQVWPYLYQAQPAPRGHKVPVCGETCGAQQVIDRLLERAQQLGASFRYETAVTALVTDADRVVGVQWRQLGESGTARAAATVLAAGGFIMNEAMMAQYLPQLTTAPMALGNTYDDGLAIRLGMSAGGDTSHMDELFITAPPYPPGILLSGMIVNKNGQRFVAEDS
jgi:3-oxo-5alpha-steroid 4-dehydrogenase